MRRILLCGMENLRDLGGYPLAGRGSERFTRWGSLYRGDLPKQVTQADRQRLRELGITTVVDLRSAEEIERKPDPLAQEPGIRYLHCPLAGDGRVPAPDEVPLSYMEMADGTGRWQGRCGPSQRRRRRCCSTARRARTAPAWWPLCCSGWRG